MKSPSVNFLFAPGAGAPSAHPWMSHWAELIGSLGLVQMFDYPYMREGRRHPDPLPILLAAHRSALASLRDQTNGPIVLIGKSMGSRIGCYLAPEDKVSAIVCLGYPLCGGADRTKIRDKVLRNLETPVLFVQGTRDSLCPLELLAEVRHQMVAASELHEVDAGDHSLLVTKTKLKECGETQEDVDRRILDAISRFLAKHLPIV